MELEDLFNSWGKKADDQYDHKQWLLSKWEVVEGIEWSEEKICLMIDTIVQGLQLKSSDLVIDLGCGGGWILYRLKSSVKHIIGLDFSTAMLAHANATYPEETFICGAIGQLPFQSEICDCALSYFVFLNFMDDQFVQDALLDVYRILKKGGRALIGQLPDATRSGDYDEAKARYQTYCERVFDYGKSHRDTCRAPQKLFDRAALSEWLSKLGIPFQIRDSFNPFYRPDEPETVDWRFDIILKK